MAVEILGKRKRRAPEQITTQEEIESNDDDVRARFQKAFEAKFKPLPQIAISTHVTHEDDEDADDHDDDSDWDGISDEEEESVKVVDHWIEHDIEHEDQKREMKAFMSSKPPSSMDALFATASKRKKAASTDDKDDTETSNLKHDLALQRLLKESHLLDPNAVSSGSSYTPEGKARIKALDLRLKDLGAKKAILEQEKMPMAFRKGIVGKASAREATRRKEAAENGVILERATAMKVQGGNSRDKQRERGMSGPGVGKLRGSTLKLSQRDVRSIEGPKQRDGGKGKKGRR